GLEAFGGAGYVEDTGLPVLLRDAQVLPIWEGTTNVLSLDALRAVAREGALEAWVDLVVPRLEPLGPTPLAAEAAALTEAVRACPRPADEGEARHFALRVAVLAAAVPLLEQAAWALARGRGERSAWAVRRWLAGRRAEPADAAQARRASARVLSGLEG